MQKKAFIGHLLYKMHNISRRRRMKKVKSFDFKKPPKNPGLRWLVQIICAIGLSDKNFVLRKHNMEGLEKTPFILLSNHASMTDLMVAQKIIYPQRLNNVASLEAFHNYTAVLFRHLGVIAKCNKTLMLFREAKCSAKILHIQD